MNQDGTYLDTWRFSTSEAELIEHLVSIKAKHKVLTLEEGPLAFWIARTLHHYVEQVFICDPKENFLISHSSKKRDRYDTYSLCRLLRLGELKRVYHPQVDHRALFKAAAQTYLELRRQQVALKQKIKAKYRQWGVFELDGTRLYHDQHRQHYLEALEHQVIAAQVSLLYDQLDQALAGQQQAKQQMLELGKRYVEIAQFVKMPGLGVISAHLFDAYVQTPHRFQTRQQLWCYSALAVTDRSSDGKPLGYKRLDRAGNTVLKQVSYRVWLSAMRRKAPNEVRQFFEASLMRTHDRRHARLNTQRKILTSLWTLWKKQLNYTATGFLGTALA
jgi:transposase